MSLLFKVYKKGAYGDAYRIHRHKVVLSYQAPESLNTLMINVQSFHLT